MLQFIIIYIVVIIALKFLRKVIAYPFGLILKAFGVKDHVDVSQMGVEVVANLALFSISLIGIWLLFPYVWPMFAALFSALGELFSAVFRLILQA